MIREILKGLAIFALIVLFWFAVYYAVLFIIWLIIKFGGHLTI